MFLLRTNSLVVILSLIIFHGKYIFGLGAEELKDINVLAKLNNITAGCDLHDFLQLDSDFKKLSDDLTEYCSPLKSVKQYRILCHMLSYELEKACALPAKSRPSKAVYTSKTSAKEICAKKNIQLTNQWIWNKLTNNGQKDIGITAKYLCSSVTSDMATRRLARFFYKIAPLIREADSSQQATDKGQSKSTVSISGAAKYTKNDNADVVPTSKEKAQQSIETKTKETGEGTKDKAAQTEEGTKDKTAQPGEGTKEKANPASEESKDKTALTGEGVKDKTSQTGEQAKDKTNEGTKDKAAQTGEGMKDKTAQTGEGVKDKTVQTEEGTKDKASEGTKGRATQTGEGTKDKTAQTGEGVKDKTVQTEEGTKDKTSEGVKDKAAQTGEGAKDKAAETGEGVKDKTAQTDEGTKGKAVKTGEGVKDKAAQTGEVTKDKTIQTGEGIKEKAGEGEKLNVSSNIISNKDNKTDLIHGNVDKGKPSEESLSNKTSEKTQLRKNATNELSPKTDENGQKVLDLNKDNKSELKNKTDQASTNDEDNDNGDEKSEETEQAAQIPKPDLVNKKEGENEKKDKETNNDRDINSNDPNDGPEEDEVDEDAIKQLRDQQKESDKDDLQSAVGDKEKTANHEDLPPHDYGTTNDSDQQVKAVDPSNDDEDAEDQGINRDPNGMNIRKPTDEDRTGFGKTAEKNTKNSGSESSKARPKASVSRKYAADDDGWSGSFVTYFLLFTLFVVIGYLVLHNKNKILGLLIEGCRRNRSSIGRRHGGSSSSTRLCILFIIFLMAYVVEGRRSGAPRTGSRPSHRGYEKLKNVNDIIPIDDINPISDKDVIILKT
ncbi:unnamed protein product [Rotaria magnacalcarata]|uniref:Trans-Golgi network integral membrane protein 2 n=1 Tax=Rotaria magnacalcarata TaxID=392030 RepID=A0A819L0B3_9BILA|nr:unnamed protein product [Rotaria magnacalcarata]